MNRHRLSYQALRKRLLLVAAACLLAASCSSSADSVATSTPDAETESDSSSDASAGDSSDASTDDSTGASSDATGETDAETTTAAVDAGSCDDIASAFVVNDYVNPDLDEPEASATCVDGMVVVTSNGIPDFPYTQTTPGNPSATSLEYTIPATPTVADTPTTVPAIGAIAVALNGIPIFGAAEGPGGDVLSMPSFTECGGHNGPSGYHFHLFTTAGSTECGYSDEEVMSEQLLFGYAFDGYPIYVGNYALGYTSSYELTDPSLFASNTFEAHTYVEGSGDLDECNGRTDENGNYAYYTTDTYPYTVGCYVGVVADSGGAAGGDDRPARPEPGEEGEDGEDARPARPEPGEEGDDARPEPGEEGEDARPARPEPGEEGDGDQPAPPEDE